MYQYFSMEKNPQTNSSRPSFFTRDLSLLWGKILLMKSCWQDQHVIQVIHALIIMIDDGTRCNLLAGESTPTMSLRTLTCLTTVGFRGELLVHPGTRNRILPTGSTYVSCLIGTQEQKSKSLLRPTALSGRVNVVNCWLKALVLGRGC